MHKNNVAVKNDSSRIKRKKFQKNEDHTESTDTISNKLYQLLLRENKSIKCKKTSRIICNACELDLSPTDNFYEHISDVSHLKNLHESKTNNRLLIAVSNNKKELSSMIVEYFYCHKCNFWFKKDETWLQCHCMMHLYQDFPDLKCDIVQFNFNKEKKVIIINCLICNYETNCEKNLANHIHEIGHLQNLQNNLLYQGKLEQIKTISYSKLQHFFDAITESKIFTPQNNLFLHVKCICNSPKKIDNYGNIRDFMLKNLKNSHDHVENDDDKNNSDESFMYYKCFLCDQSFPTAKNLLLHYINKSGHKHRYKNYFGKIINGKIVKHDFIQSCNDNGDKVFEFHGNKMSKITINKFSQHNSVVDQQMASFSKTKKYLYCKLCQFYIPSDQYSYIQGHCMFHLHMDHPILNNDIIKYTSINDKMQIKCLLCNYITNYFNELNNHLTQGKHLSKIQLLKGPGSYEFENDVLQGRRIYPEIVESSNHSIGFYPKTNFTLESFCTTCFVPEKNQDGCTKKFNNVAVTSDHKHNNDEDRYFSQAVSLNTIVDFYKCYMCNVSCVNKETLFDHYQKDPLHQQKFAKVNIDKILKDTLSEDQAAKKKQVKKSSTEESETNVVVVKKQQLVKKDNNNSIVIQNDKQCKIKNNDEKDKDENEEDYEEESDEDDDESSASLSNSERNNQVDKMKNHQEVIKFKKQKRIRAKDEVDDWKTHAYNDEIREYGEKFLKLCIESGPENIYTFKPEELQIINQRIEVMFPYFENCVCLVCDYEMPFEPQRLYEHVYHDLHVENQTKLKNLKLPNVVLSAYDLAKVSITESSSKKELICISCNENFDNNSESIIKHLITTDHLSKCKENNDKMSKLKEEMFNHLRNFWYCAVYFYCTACKLEFQGELNFVCHLVKENNQHDLKKCKIGRCLTCCSCWYGPDSYVEHIDTYFHNLSCNRRSLRPPILDKRSMMKWKYINNKGSETISQNLIRESNKVERFDIIRENHLLQDIERTVRPIYPKAKAYVFGSRCSGLSLFESDVDIFLDLENLYFKKGSRLNAQKYIKSVCKQFFSNNPNSWKREVVLLTPRIPIIKFEHRATHLKCDLSFMNGLGVEKSLLIRRYVMAYSGCREMILYLKKWFDAIKLYGPRGINAYAISWFTIFYLQRIEILPSVCELKAPKASKIVDGWECDFSRKIIVGSRASKYKVKDLLQGFFNYYSMFDYQTCVVCPLNGKIAKKSDFLTIEKMAKETKIYKNRLKTEDLEYFRYDSPMCIQDPVDLSQNITKNVKKKQLEIFKQYCKNTKV